MYIYEFIYANICIAPFEGYLKSAYSDKSSSTRATELLCPTAMHQNLSHTTRLLNN